MGRRLTIQQQADRHDAILAAATRLCHAARSGESREASFEAIRMAVPGSTYRQIEEAVESCELFCMNVAIRVGNGIYELAKKNWSAEWMGEDDA